MDTLAVKWRNRAIACNSFPGSCLGMRCLAGSCLLHVRKRGVSEAGASRAAGSQAGAWEPESSLARLLGKNELLGLASVLCFFFLDGGPQNEFCHFRQAVKPDGIEAGDAATDMH